MTPGASNGAFVDGDGLRELVAAAARAVERNKDEINALNVFPVPDGDTGTNMSSTLAAVVDDARQAPDTSLEPLTATMARSALLGARGNSGLILAQFFRGLSQGVSGSDTLGGREFASALRHGATAAYNAVEKPVEGTMLTVMREAAEAAESAVADSEALTDILAATCERARDCVARTPTMLEILREAGVVDAGGYGFAVVLEGALANLRGQSDGAVLIAAPEPIGVDMAAGVAGAPRIEFVQAASETVYGYCTTFVIEGEGLDPEQVRKELSGMGESSVVAGDDRQVKVHLHPLTPGPLLTYAAELGVLAGISILNMDEQTRQWVEARQAEREAPQVGVAVVAVAAGAGLTAIFAREGMGASTVIAGGDTMNPSVAELVEAVDAAASENVIILPNNRNIVGTAREAASLSDKTVEVVPTATVQEGVAALLAFSPDQPLEANLSAMTDAAGAVLAGGVTRATRDVTLNGRHVNEGDMIGLLGGEVVCCGSEAEQVAIDLVRQRAVDGELVTIYRGDGVAPEDAEEVAAAVREWLGDIEVEVVDGGQPHYPYLIAIE